MHATKLKSAVNSPKPVLRGNIDVKKLGVLSHHLKCVAPIESIIAEI